MIFLSLLALLYFLPTIAASRRGHEITGVLLLNLFFGWTVIGWFALLLWALLSHPVYRVYPAHVYAPRVYEAPAGNSYPPDYWRR